MEKIHTRSWSDYEVIDSGNQKKLERFGDVILIRPEISATWLPELDIIKWNKLAWAEFIEEESLKGEWIRKREIPENWFISYPLDDHSLIFSLKLTRFKHVGVFPEQSVNWEFLYKEKPGSVLNLFAHTGGASQAAFLGGARVTHIDSVYSMVGWAKLNGEMSGTQGIKWICEEAGDFVLKEIKRNNTYDLVILDPPSFGQSKKGKTWKIERDLSPLMGLIKKILKPGGQIILNCYSIRLGEGLLIKLLQENFTTSQFTLFHHVLVDNNQRELNCGILVRIQLI